MLTRLTALGLLLLPACGPAEVRSVLRLKRVEPEGGLLFLNQELRFVFDGPLDPGSVTGDTIRILDEAGNPVPGRFKVHSFTVTFYPIVPLTPELTDGSFQPGRAYHCALPCFPLSNSVRGAGGQVLLEAPGRSWRAVTRETIPEDFPSELLRISTNLTPFTVLPAPILGEGEIRLRFSRPLYPPSARPAALRLLRAGGEEIPLREVRVLRGPGPGGYGSTLGLRPARPLQAGRYRIRFEPGSRGLLDYSLSPVRVPVSRGGRIELRTGGEELDYRVAGRPVPALLEVDFRRGGRKLPFPSDPRSEGLLTELEGGLCWGKEGLSWPALGFRGFQSLGSFDPEGHSEVLKAGMDLTLERGSRKRLSTVWDFDRFRVPKGCRVFIVLDRKLSLRVAGRMEVEGELLFRLKGPAPSRERGDALPREGDPLEAWGKTEPRIEIRVGGLCRLSGRLKLEGSGEKDLVPGFLLGRGPFYGPWEESDLEPWVWSGGGEGGPPTLPGTWGIMSEWRKLPSPERLAGEIWRDGSGEGSELEVRVQALRQGGGVTAWVPPALLPDLGRIEALRFVLLVEGRHYRPGVLVRTLGLR